MRSLRVLLRRYDARPARSAAEIHAENEDLRKERDVLRGTLAALGSTDASTIPPELHAAAYAVSSDGHAVRVDVGEEQMIVVLGDEPGGTPLQWWAELRRWSDRAAS